jgi:hypothetical protein
LDPTSYYTVDKFYEWLRGPEDADHPTNRWDDAHISLALHTNINSAVDAFKKSLQDTDAVVVYLGHSSLDFKHKRSVGLAPTNPHTAEIPGETLTSLLNDSKAGLVILASCASSTCVGKLTRGPAVVVTDSGDDLKTWSDEWANALGAFLLVLIGYEVGPSRQPVPRKNGRGTIGEALGAANKEFKDQNTTDHFVLANGNPSKVIFPEK